MNRSGNYTFQSLDSTSNDTGEEWMKSDSTCTLAESEITANDPKKVKRRVRNNVRSTRVESAYTPHNRLSRYKPALRNIVPFRVSSTGTSDLPVDKIGCFSNSSFSWIRKFFITREQQRAYQSLSTSNWNNKQDEVYLLPKTPYSDSCEVNCRRLLGIYNYNETLNGRKKVSMLKVIWRFTRTRLIIASLFHCFAIFLIFLGVVLFSNMTVESMQTVVSTSCQNCTAISNCSSAPSKILGIQFEMNNNGCKSASKIQSMDGRNDRILLSLGVLLCFFIAMIFNSVKNWLNLRTAVRLRTAVLSSIYKRAMKSSIVNNISAHQIMTLTNEESEFVFKLVESVVQLFGISIGLILAIISGFILLPISVVLISFGVCPLLVLLFIIGNISKIYYRKFLAFGVKKHSIVEEICFEFKNIKVLQMESIYKDRFMSYLDRQYGALRWCNIYSTKALGGVTSAILVGGLYLIWCDTNIKTESTEVLILLLVFAYHVQNLMLDFCNCINNFIQGKATLDKIKHSYQLLCPDNVRLKPNRENLAIQANNTEAGWPPVDGDDNRQCKFKLCLENFEIVSGQIIGVTGHSGGGKTTLLHTLLRNVEIQKGRVLHRGKLAFFPSEPVLLNDSLKENVLFGEPFDAQRYYLAVHAVELNEDVLQAAGADDIPIVYLELTTQQLERITLARAVYCHRQIILLDEPLNRFSDRHKAKHLFSQVLTILRQDNKTVIVGTQWNELLQYCDRVFRIDDGAIYREGCYAEILNMPSHVEMTRKCNIATVCRGYGQPNATGSDPAALYIATNAFCKRNRRSASVENDTEQPQSAKQTLASMTIQSFSICDILLLIVMHLLNGVLYFGPVLMLIVIVEQGDINPWLSTLCLGVIVCTLVIDSVSKIYVARISTNRNRSYQEKLLDQLMRGSLTYLQHTSVSDVLNLFTDNISTGFIEIDSCIFQATMVLLSATVLVIANFWAACVVSVLLTVSVALIYYVQYSLQHLYNHEHLSRRQMFAILTNHLAGRAVIQSFDSVSSFVQKFYDNVEENSTAIYMQRSIQFFVQFWVNFVAYFLGISALLVILLFTSQSEVSIHRYILAIFGYLSMIRNLEKFVEHTLLTMIAHKKRTILKTDISQLQCLKEVKDPASLTNSDIGVSVVIRDVVYRVANKKMLKIPSLRIQAGETVAIIGTGSDLIIPLLCRIISPNQGTVSLNQIDITRLKTDH
ncbi:ATP-binding cassette sub-family C member 12-like isoform X2 [Sabethes cyaneus]|uniref:ATP-binding cassette sub-family C member 12-like isoform X2 n=1 Tax=Sabethes cyaneus TaxID=53552 RepID=UPI00237DC30D|nr:ATP-binding cassette sub-family C member 12-like isoform X2 [Sabethes cyaneus]